jgi:uncharacterized protein (TIGR02594 family)
MAVPPWIKDSLPQKDSNEPGVKDLYKSEDVFVNNANVVLYDPPAGAAGGALVSLSPTQITGIEQSAVLAISPEEAEVGLTGVGEVPQEGEVQLLGEVTGSDTFSKIANALNNCLLQARAGAWRENGRNAHIVQCYRAVGFRLSSDSTPWCAGFSGFILKSAGAGHLNTLSSLAYRGYGTAVPLNDKSKWRLNDVVVFSRKGGGHIGFFRGYNPSNGSVLIAGGNQSNNLTEVGFRSGRMPIVYVGRNWTVPANFDRPITYSGSGGLNRVV